MRFETLDAEAGFALRAVTQAAQVCRRLEVEGSPAASKADHSPVTAAYFAAQAVVGRLMQEAFPADGVVAEEDSRLILEDASPDRLATVVKAVRRIFPEATAGKVRQWIDRGGERADRYWALDPLDGTKGFLRDGQYAVALALLEEGHVVLGAIACPKLGLAKCGSLDSQGTVAIAVRSSGAFAAPLGSDAFVRLSVSPVREPKRARLLRSFEADHTDVTKRQIAALWAFRRRRSDPQPGESSFSRREEGVFGSFRPAGPTARGSDQAAGALLVEEAGGRVTDLAGASLDFQAGRTLERNIGVLASNGWLHTAALEAIHQAGADRRPTGRAE
jgi:3'(2'), 5'-bisphosphate nucleotidase